ncbi:MAG: cation:proton antiporter, partial [Terriglobales bacterium]
MPQSALQGLFSLFVVFAAAKIGEEVFERLGQPPLIGQIVFGFLVGPAVLGWVAPSSALDFMSEIGVIFLLFETGLDTQPEEILRHGVTSFTVALIGVITPLVVGWWFALAAGENAITARFVGTLLVATSIGITAKILEDFGATHTAFGQVILGAAVLDDILGLLALSTLSSFASERAHLANLLLTLGFVVAFFLLVLFLRRAAVPKVTGPIRRMRARAPVWSAALVVLLAFSVMSAEIGLAAIIGAFLAGIFLSEREEVAGPLRQQAGAVSSFVVPFFLAT